MSTAPVLQVVQVLCAAAGPDATARKSAHDKLQELEGQRGFVVLLLEAYADSSAEPQGRYLAILMCKNMVDRHWQPRQANTIDPEEKRLVKECILKLIKVAVAGSIPHLVELAMVLRRICRLDFPQHWDALAHFFVSELQQVQQLGFNENALGIIMVLHHVLKEQATKKLLSARKDFHRIGQALIEHLGAVWHMKLQRMQQDANPDLEDDRMWKLSRYLDGCFLILLAQGFAHLHDVPNGPNMIVLMKDNVMLLLNLLRMRPGIMGRCPFFLKNLKSVLKWWAILVHAHPLAFAQANIADVLHSCVEVLQSHCAVVQASPRSHEVLQSLQGLVRSSLQALTNACNTVAYRQGPQPTHQGVTLEAARACHAQFAEFLQRHSVDSMCDLCSSVALRQPAEEVQVWLSDPEDQLQGPGSQTVLHVAGENFIKSLVQPPLERPLVEHVARRMKEEAAQPLSLSDSFDVVVRKDTFFLLLSLCQKQLKSYLQVQFLLNFLAPVAVLVPQMNDKAPCVLLGVRLCSVLRAWSKDIPQDMVMPVLQLLGSLLQDGNPKAVRLATLGPLREILDRFSDHEAWATLQGPLIDACLALLSKLSTPESQWRSLNLIHLFLCEEAESGRYEAAERSLGQLVTLWRQPDQGDMLICHALLDVVRALVLMSCRTRQPRLPLSQPLLSCCLVMISDCFAHHRGTGIASVGLEANAALEVDASVAAERLGDRGNASATLFDSGSMLFLAVLRTVDVGQAGPLLGLFPQLLEHYSCQTAGAAGGAALHDHALDILLEYCSLIIRMVPPESLSQGAPQLRPHCDSLAMLCGRCLQREKKDRICEQCFQLLQLLLAYCAPGGGPDGGAGNGGSAIGSMQGLLEPLFCHWATNYQPQKGPMSFEYPMQSLIPLFCAWQAHHKQHFKQQACSAAPGSGPHVAMLLVACCRFLRPVPVRVATLLAALALTEEGGTSEAFWREFLQGCNDLIVSTQKKGSSATLASAMQGLKSSLATRLPVAARSSLVLQIAVLPPELCRAMQEDTPLDEVALVRWFFNNCAQTLQRLGQAQSLNLQALLMAAPAQVQEAFRATGM